MTVAIYPATFDPITYGHVDIATRAACMFERLIVAVHDRPLKNLLFSPEERWDMVSKALAHLSNVQVELYHGLTIEYGPAGKPTRFRGASDPRGGGLALAW